MALCTWSPDPWLLPALPRGFCRSWREGGTALPLQQALWEGPGVSRATGCGGQLLPADPDRPLLSGCRPSWLVQRQIGLESGGQGSCGVVCGQQDPISLLGLMLGQAGSCTQQG